MKIDGAVLAIDRLGQRDTRWFTPLTVSGGYQGEEGNRRISGACSYPTAASAFSILTAYYRRLRLKNASIERWWRGRARIIAD